jgi:hypothetical protein
LLQTPLACPYLGRHPLEDACQLPQGVVPTGDAVQLSAFEASRLDGTAAATTWPTCSRYSCSRSSRRFLASPALILARRPEFRSL